MLLSLQSGSQVLKELQKEMSLERAESIVDRVGEGVAAQRVSVICLICDPYIGAFADIPAGLATGNR